MIGMGTCVKTESLAFTSGSCDIKSRPTFRVIEMYAGESGAVVFPIEHIYRLFLLVYLEALIDLSDILFIVNYFLIN